MSETVTVSREPWRDPGDEKDTRPCHYCGGVRGELSRSPGQLSVSANHTYRSWWDLIIICAKCNGEGFLRWWQ